MDDDLELILRSWRRSMKARNLAPRTVDTYLDAVQQLTAHSGATTLAALDRRAVEDYLSDLAARAKPTTVSVRFRALQQFYRWLEDEEHLAASPMAKMRPPQVPIEPVPILGAPELKRLLATCATKSFDDLRDRAMLLLFIDGGLRLNEMTGLAVDDIDDEHDTVMVMGKGRRPRAVPFGTKVGQALDRYRLARRRHAHASSNVLWLGLAGPLTDNGIAQLVRRRAAQAGLDGVHPHMLRHSWAHHWRTAGGQDGDLQRLGGWSSPQMLQRYGASAADERARDAHRRFSLGDRL